MSLRTWKGEFYPEEPNHLMSPQAAIEHSIRKWEGAKKVNLRKHGVVLRFDRVCEPGSEYAGVGLPFNSTTCALCRKFNSYRTIGIRCASCPLTAVGQLCGSDGSAYSKWLEDYNAVDGVLEALREASIYEEDKLTNVKHKSNIDS